MFKLLYKPVAIVAGIVARCAVRGPILEEPLRKVVGRGIYAAARRWIQAGWGEVLPAEAHGRDTRWSRRLSIEASTSGRARQLRNPARRTLDHPDKSPDHQQGEPPPQAG